MDEQEFAGDLRDYLFDMLSQLANVADGCGERGIALVLQTIVASRWQDAGFNGGRHPEDCSKRPG